MKTNQPSSLPLVSGEISCGLFGVMDDFFEHALSLDEKYQTKNPSTFFVRAAGESMAPEIKPQDLLIIDRSVKLFHGCIATFYYQGQSICKQYIKTKTGIELQSYNKKFSPLIVKDEDQLELFGVVVGIVRDLL